jgi:hypothetical protein
MTIKRITASSTLGATSNGYSEVIVYAEVTLSDPQLVGLSVTDTTPVSVYNLGVIGPNRLADETGVYLKGGGLVVNYGASTIGGQRAIVALGAGPSTVVNNGLITGGTQGVALTNTGAVFNYGTIRSIRYGAVTSNGEGALAAVTFGIGGYVVNGTGSDPTALIVGVYGIVSSGAATVTNFGTIQALGNLGTIAGSIGGVDIESDGVSGDTAVISNGAGVDTTARIVGQRGVRVAGRADVYNYGTIVGGAGPGVLTLGFSKIFNGGGTDTASLIRGLEGVFSPTGADVVNMGTIDGTAAVGVDAGTGGTIVNGSPDDTTALIEGALGVITYGAGSITNYGTIHATRGYGFSGQGGIVINGGDLDHTALIEGSTGVGFSTAPGVLENYGTVKGLGAGGFGVNMKAGGTITNGSFTDATAHIEGFNGVSIATTSLAGAATNFGTILGLGHGGEGALLNDGAAIANGSASRANAVISGYTGVLALGPGTLVNFGTVIGAGGVAVKFNTSAETLAVGAGASFVGSVDGGGGTLELVNGTGTLTGLLAGGSVTVSGSMATTTFNNFGAVKIDAGASFALAGAGGTVSAGQTLSLLGTLGGTGALTIAGGTASFGTGASLAIAKVSETAGSATFAANLTVADAWTQTGGTVSAGTGDKASFTGTNTFSGTLGGTGTLAFTGGVTTLSATTISASSARVAGGAVTLSGTLDITKTLTVSASSLTVAAAGASLTGAGTVALTSSAANAIVGATTSATLVNVNDKINGGGQLGEGKLVLVNNAGATIDADTATALIINTGTNAVANGGLIESISTGGLSIAGALTNTGTLSVSKGTLSVGGAVSGAGTVKISGGTAAFAAAFNENVTFSGTTASVLGLGASQTYAGQISGFSKTGNSTLDLMDIAFGGSTKATYSGNSVSGVLTVTDGTHTAKVTLAGDYTAATFTVSSDGHGGTNVIDPTAPKAGGHTVPLLTAMAGFARTPAFLQLAHADPPRLGSALLVHAV